MINDLKFNLIMVLTILIIISCKKEGNKPTADFISDRMTLAPGQKVNFTDLSGNNPTGWDWAFQGGEPASSNLQNPAVVYNTSGLYSVKLVAKNSDGEGVQSKNNYITVFDFGDLPDHRDNKNYPTIKIGTQTWMASNLDYQTASGSCFYQNRSDFENTYGRLYIWDSARVACPQGWHLPSDAEWTVLINYIGGAASAGKLKEPTTTHWDGPNIGAINTTGFTALPGGIKYNNMFSEMGKSANFWTNNSFGGTDAWSYNLTTKDAVIYKNSSTKSDYLSVRCLKD
jgi:uncharacterized protein (TIGR02145 family)